MDRHVHMLKKANIFYDNGKNPKVDEEHPGVVAEVRALPSSSATPCPPKRQS